LKVRGFTLIELLVVIAIIAILIALLVPAAQKMRGAPARAHGQNNLKQIGLALHNSHDSYQKFPTGHRNSVAAANWRVLIFPYLEQAPLYNQLVAQNNNKLDNIYDAGTRPLANTVIPIWKCPSTSVPELQPQAWVTWWTNYNHMVPSYQGIMGATPDPSGSTGTSYASNYGGWWCNNGMLLANEFTRFADCIDGTSNTIIAAE